MKKSGGVLVQYPERMRRTLLIAATALLALGPLARADVIIYRMLESNRTIGYDRNRTGTAAGYMALDWDTGEIRILRAQTLYGSKQFTVINPQGVRVYVANGPNGSTYTVISRYEEKTAPFTEVMDVLYGVDKVLAIRPDRRVYSPATIKGSLRNILVGDNEDDVELTTSTTTSTYLNKETQAANAANQTVDGVMERYRALYLSRGYYEVQDTQ